MLLQIFANKFNFMDKQNLDEEQQKLFNEGLKFYAKEVLGKKQNNSNNELPKATGSYAIEIIKGYNKRLYANYPGDCTYAEKINEVEDNNLHFYMFTRTITYHFLLDIKQNLKTDIEKLNICSLYAMLSHFEKKLIRGFNLDGDQIIENKPKVLYEHLVIFLNRIDPYKQTYPFGFNKCFHEYWELTIKDIYSKNNSGENIFNFSDFCKRSEWDAQELTILPQIQQVIPKDLIEKINSWSDNFEKDIYSKNNLHGFLEENLYQYDWDTRFLFLNTWIFINFLWRNHKNQLKEGTFLSVYAILVSITFGNLESYFDINEYQAVMYIPNLFIRLYDYLVMMLGRDQELGLENQKFNKSRFECWYRIHHLDFV